MTRFISNWGWGYITGVMMGLPLGIYAVNLLGFLPGTVNVDLFAAGMLLGSSLLATWCRISLKQKSKLQDSNRSPVSSRSSSASPSASHSPLLVPTESAERRDIDAA